MNALIEKKPCGVSFTGLSFYLSSQGQYIIPIQSIMIAFGELSVVIRFA